MYVPTYMILGTAVLCCCAIVIPYHRQQQHRAKYSPTACVVMYIQMA